MDERIRAESGSVGQCACAPTPADGTEPLLAGDEGMNLLGIIGRSDILKHRVAVFKR